MNQIFIRSSISQGCTIILNQANALNIAFRLNKIVDAPWEFASLMSTGRGFQSFETNEENALSLIVRSRVLETTRRPQKNAHVNMVCTPITGLTGTAEPGHAKP